MSEILGWHFLRDDSTRAQDGVRVEPGATETWDGSLELCASGLHFCPRLLDALRYAPGALIRRVELSGEVVMGSGDHSDKGCAGVRRELWRADATTLLHEFACDMAEQALDRVAAAGGTVDPRSRAAILAKRAWLSGEVTDAELDAARAAAWDAAWDAASDAARAAAGDAARVAAWAAAWVVARDAAWAAARDAARDAARAAAWVAARVAARAAAWDAMNADLERRLLALPEAREERSAS